MENVKLNYFVFPRLALSESDFRNLSIFLPRVSILEISQPAAIPEWCGDRFSGAPIVHDTELLKLIKSCTREYHAFAEVHGGKGGALGYLAQAFDESGESRFRIQDELRDKCPTGSDAGQNEFISSAVFLDIAAELDRKESELESDYARADALEKKFSEILGIDEEEGSTEIPATLSTPLVPPVSGPGYMVSERIKSWFRLFSSQPLDFFPVFVTTDSQSLGEALDLIRAGCRAEGREPGFSEIRLGSFPRPPDLLGQKQFRSLVESPGSPALLENYRNSLDLFLEETAGRKSLEELEAASESVRSALEKFCKGCDISGPDQVSLRLYVSRDVSVNDVVDVFRGAGGRAGVSAPSDAQQWPAMFLCLD